MPQWLLRMCLGCILLTISAEAGMVCFTPDEYFMDIGTMSITIAKNSGKLTRLRIRNTLLNIVSLWPHYGLFFVEMEMHGSNCENAGCWPGVDVFTEPTLLFDSDSLPVIHFDWNAPKISALR
jgi:hypothetical protein